MRRRFGLGFLVVVTLVALVGCHTAQLEEEAGSQVLLFDPEFGQVYLPWENLPDVFSGKLLYLYLNQ